MRKVPTEQKHCISFVCSEVAMSAGSASCRGSLRLETLGRTTQETLVDLGVTFPGSNPGFATSWLCGLGHVI